MSASSWSENLAASTAPALTAAAAWNGFNEERIQVR